MWTRRVLLATLVAAAAMSLPRQVPASWGTGGFDATSVISSSSR
jgi:hypothetical protein